MVSFSRGPTEQLSHVLVNQCLVSPPLLPPSPPIFFFNSESPQSALTYSSAADNGEQLFVAVISIARESSLLAASPEGRSEGK